LYSSISTNCTVATVSASQLTSGSSYNFSAWDAINSVYAQTKTFTNSSGFCKFYAGDLWDLMHSEPEVVNGMIAVVTNGSAGYNLSESFSLAAVLAKLRCSSSSSPCLTTIIVTSSETGDRLVLNALVIVNPLGIIEIIVIVVFALLFLGSLSTLIFMEFFQGNVSDKRTMSDKRWDFFLNLIIGLAGGFAFFWVILAIWSSFHSVIRFQNVEKFSVFSCSSWKIALAIGKRTFGSHFSQKSL